MHIVQALSWKPLNLESKAQIGGYLKKLESCYQAVKSQEDNTEESRIEESVSPATDTLLAWLTET